mgnify:CR=1 FL=1
MVNKDQLRNVAKMCSQYRYQNEGSLRDDVDILDETVKSCENCSHYTVNHKCELNLTDEILSNMDVKLD